MVTAILGNNDTNILMIGLDPGDLRAIENGGIMLDFSQIMDMTDASGALLSAYGDRQLRTLSIAVFTGADEQQVGEKLATLVGAPDPATDVADAIARRQEHERPQGLTVKDGVVRRSGT